MKGSSLEARASVWQRVMVSHHVQSADALGQLKDGGRGTWAEAEEETMEKGQSSSFPVRAFLGLGLPRALYLFREELEHDAPGGLPVDGDVEEGLRFGVVQRVKGPPGGARLLGDTCQLGRHSGLLLLLS